jgi:secreted Zn-dependent insulinase-like peptidase
MMMMMMMIEEQLVSTADILRVFEKYTVEKLRDFVRLNFEDTYFSTVMMHTDREKQCCIMILSPDMHESLLRCIYEIMQLGNFVYTRDW